MNKPKSISWKRAVTESAVIVGSILLAFAIDAWWDEFRDREAAKVVLESLHDELVKIDDVMSWHDQYVGAMRDSARRLLISAVGRDQGLEEREIDRLLADLVYFVGVTWFEVPELDSLALDDDLSLIENEQLRRKLRSWRVRNEFFRRSVERQADFHNDRVMPYLESNTSLQQIYNAASHMPGFPEDVDASEKIELREYRSHSVLLDDPVFQNLLTRRIGRLDNLLNSRDERYVPELGELIAQIEQELSEYSDSY